MHPFRPRELHRSHDTRWNSVYDELRTLLEQRSQFEHFLDSERQRNDPNGFTTIAEDALDADDWAILAQYLKLLEPCWAATMDLQGYVQDGKSSSLVNVLNDIELIVIELSTMYVQYKDAPKTSLEGEWHFATQIRLALDKAEAYYAKLDDTAAYLAALVLHPSYNWRFVERRWHKQVKWLKAGKAKLKALWYSTYKHTEAPIESPQKPRSYEPNMMEAYRLKTLAEVKAQARKAPNSLDEFERYLMQPSVTTDKPIEWWSTVGCIDYPYLSKMALDMLSIPAMSDEPERLFSRLGHMVTKHRNHLKPQTIEATQCLQSWAKAKIIDLKQ